MPRNQPSPRSSVPNSPQRLQKVLALAGYGSRRACEQLITDGRVEIDRKIVVELGTRIDPSSQQLRVDGETVRLPEFQYIALHKPVGVVSTKRDPAARMRVIDLVPGGKEMFTIGRLDLASTGLILVTNDGEFANQLAHPRYGVEKTYRVVVQGHPTPETLDKLRKGVHLSNARVCAKEIRIKSRKKAQTILQIVLDEGRNREIRRMLAQVGHKVQMLQRTAIGPLKLGKLPVGAYRPLTNSEVRRLLAAATTAGSRRSTGSGKSSRGKTSRHAKSSSVDAKRKTKRAPKRALKQAAGSASKRTGTSAGKRTGKQTGKRTGKQASKGSIRRG